MSVTIINKPDVGIESYSWTGWIESKYPVTLLFLLRSNDNSALFIGDELIIDNMGLTGLHGQATVYSDPYILKGKKSIAIYWSERNNGYGGMVKFQWMVDYEEGEGCLPDDWKYGLGRVLFFHDPSYEWEP